MPDTPTSGLAVSWACGEARQLTHGAGNNTRPLFSPDGRSLVCISDRGGREQLWNLPLDGGEPRLANYRTHLGGAGRVLDARRSAYRGGRRCRVPRPLSDPPRVERLRRTICESHPWARGEIDGFDHLRLVEWAVETGVADPERIGVMGLSGAGYMTNWLLGRLPDGSGLVSPRTQSATGSPGTAGPSSPVTRTSDSSVSAACRRMRYSRSLHLPLERSDSLLPPTLA